jgi:predicted flap endonuclease-1-like 5' DNA nuclease
MTKQTQGSMALVGAMSGGIFLVAFVALMIVGGYTFSPALFLAAAVAGAVAVFLFIAFHRKADAPVSAVAHRPPAHAPAAPTHEPAARQAPVAEPAPAPVAEPAPAPMAVVAPEPEPEPMHEAAEVEGVKPATLAAPRDGGADDLKKIKGVGPKLEAMLHGMGYFHFDQIAGWTGAEVAWVDHNLEGFKGRVSRDGWVEQARHLATGGETEFSRRVEGGDVY